MGGPLYNPPSHPFRQTQQVTYPLPYILTMNNRLPSAPAVPSIHIQEPDDSSALYVHLLCCLVLVNS